MNFIFTLAQQAASAPTPDDSWLIAGFALFGVALVFFALEFVVPSGGLIATLCVLVVAAGIFCFFMQKKTPTIFLLCALKKTIVDSDTKKLHDFF